MPSPAANAQADAVTTLLASSGEAVTIRDSEVTAVINWDTEAQENVNYPNMQMRQASRIMIVASQAFVPPLRAGELVTDGNHYTHRIQKVRFQGPAILLHCEVHA